MKKFVAMALAALMVLSMVACGSDDTAANGDNAGEKTTVKIGTIASIEPRVQLGKEILSEIDVEAEVVLFEGNAGPATALKDGDVDGIIINHLQWITAFNEANGCDLVMLEPYAYYSPTRMFSNKYSSVEEIPDGATIAVSNDPSNLGIALTMLESLGFIKLGEKTEAYYSEADIVENTKNVNLVSANVGMVTVCTWLIMRFFDSDMSLAVRGVAFLVLGVGFLLFNLRLIKIKKNTKEETV